MQKPLAFNLELVLSDCVWAKKKSGLCIKVVFKKGAKIYVMTPVGT